MDIVLRPSSDDELVYCDTSAISQEYGKLHLSFTNRTSRSSNNNYYYILSFANLSSKTCYGV